MNIAELIDILNFGVFLPIYLAILGLVGLTFHRCSYAPYDPAWVVMAGLSVPVALIAYLYWIDGVGSGGLVLYMSGILSAFLLGIRVTHHKLRTAPPLGRQFDIDSRHIRLQMLRLKRILGPLNILIITLVVIRATTQGLPILAPDPELAKVEVNTGGFGLITRLLGPSVTVSLSIVFLLTTKGMLSRFRSILAILPPLTPALISGSKGAFLVVLVCFTAVQAYLIAMDDKHRAPHAGRVILIAIMAIFGYAFLVLFLRAIGTGEEDALTFAIRTFGVRLIAYADGVFYYFLTDIHKTLVFTPSDYIFDYQIYPILSLLRIVDYKKSLGLLISGEMFGQEQLGPNPTMFVEAYAYFNYFFAPIYALLLGVLFQTLRTATFSRRRHFRAWHFLWFVMLFPLALLVSADMLLFAGEIINMILVASILWMLLAACQPAKHTFVATRET